MRYVVAILVLFATATSALGQSWSQQKQAVLTNALGNLVGTGGVSVSLHVNGNPVFEHAQGFVGPGVPATTTTRYPIASLTKQITAAAILALQEDGAIVPYSKQPFTIDTPVNTLFAGVDGWAPLTVRELLTMCSSLPDHTRLPIAGLNPSAPVDWRILLQAIKSAQRMPQPCSYNNTNYFLLAQAIEVASANDGVFGDYRRYLRQRIFARAGMTQTGFISDGTPFAAPGRAVSTYSLPDWPKGAGDVVSTVGDLQKWNAAFLAGAIVGKGAVQTLITKASSLLDVGPYAMGWQPIGPSIQHSGSLPAGYTSFNRIVFTPAGTFSIVILSNVVTDVWPKLAEQIIAAAMAL